MYFLRKAVAKYIKPPRVYKVDDLPPAAEITNEIEKVLWELRSLGFAEDEIKDAVYSLKQSKIKK
jgi:hypothetical protein